MYAAGTFSRPRARYPLQPPLEASPPESPTDTPVKRHAYSSSNASTSSQSLDGFEGRPQSRDDDVFSSSTLHSRNDRNVAHREPLNGSLYHLKATYDGPIDYQSPLSTAPTEPLDDLSRRGSQVTSQRTLRRTPRSRRIESPVQLDDPQTTGVSRSAAWDRKSSSLRSISSSLTATSQGSWSKEDVQEVAHTEPIHHSDDDDEPSAISSGSKSEQTNKPDTSPHETAALDRAAEVTVPRRRGAYPLQAPASTTNLRSLPTPPPSPTRQAQPDTAGGSSHQDELQKQNATTGKQLRRQAYPLQSPASTMDLRRAQPVSFPDGDTSQDEDQAPSGNLQAPSQTIASKPPRRRGYPLQAPASTWDLKNADMQPIVEDDTTSDESEHEATAHKEHTPGSKKTTPKRPAYPLQAPASTADVRKPQAKPQVRRGRPQHEDTSTTQAPQKNNQAKDSSSFVRQTYPLQAPANTTDAQQSPSPPVSNESDSIDRGDSTERQTPKSDATGPEFPLWRRQTYPMQAKEYRSVSPSPPTHHHEISHNKATKHHKTSEVLLPKNIPAVLNAKEGGPIGRTIVVCLDGTGDQFDSDNSNIVHLVSALKKDDPRQVTYYQAGIGTYGKNGLSSGFEAASDMAVGSGLGLHVRDAYEFLMHTYKEGDKICIFGFSRGAYTARCLAGMIHKVGLLPPRNIQQIQFAYQFYKKDTPAGWEMSADFKKTFCIDVCVYFLGCFDSVASVGIIPRQLPLSSTPTSKPRYFRHAMALDERRAKFKICRHQTKNWDDIEGMQHLSNQETHRAEDHPNLTDAEYERLSGQGKAFDSDVLEVWFAGAHADIGGGAVKNTERHKLAQIPLRWMIRQAFECDTGIIFHTKTLAEHGLDVHTLWPKYERLNVPAHGLPNSFLKRYAKELPARSLRRNKLIHSGKHEDGEPLYHLKSHMDEDWTPEQIEDFYDALTPLNDQLIQAPNWWVLEMLPVQYKVPTTPGKFVMRTGMNWGQYRGIEDAEPKLHWTVRHRMQQLGYKLGARTAKGVRWQTVV